MQEEVILFLRGINGLAYHCICRTQNVRDTPRIFCVGIAIVVVYNNLWIVILAKTLS